MTHVRERAGKPRRSTARTRGQALVEFALIAPVMLGFGFVCIDIGRLLYTYAAISDAAGETARTIALQASANTDCLAFSRATAVAQGFPLSVDPNSLAGNTDPNNPSGSLQPSTPSPNTGYIYLWPAVAPAAPPATNCNGQPRQFSQSQRHVAVEIQFHFIPLTPLPGGDIVVKTVSVEQTEY
jgi:Flp pilus assembly protein TadG